MPRRVLALVWQFGTLAISSARRCHGLFTNHLNLFTSGCDGDVPVKQTAVNRGGYVRWKAVYILSSEGNNKIWRSVRQIAP